MPSMPATAISLILVILFGAATSHAIAQRGPPVEIQGLVIDDNTGGPIAGARVTAYTTWGQRLATTVTEAEGRFRFEVNRRGGVVLHAERVGYREATSPFLRFDGRLFFSVEIRLAVDAVLLAPLEVLARSEVRRSPLFDSFDHRARSGFGSYFTRSDIERLGPLYVTDLLTRVPGVRVEGRYVSMARQIRMGSCPVQVFMDGRLMNRRGDIAIDELVSPGDVEGVEVYHGPAALPPEFFNEWARCGVIAIWTRRGG